MKKFYMHTTPFLISLLQFLHFRCKFVTIESKFLQKIKLNKVISYYKEVILNKKLLIFFISDFDSNEVLPYGEILYPMFT